MIKRILIILILGATAPSIIAQKNRLSLYSGLFHNYFDGSPMLNINYHSDGWSFFKNRFYSSFGIAFQRELASKSVLNAEIDYLTNNWSYVIADLKKNAIYSREYLSINIGYKRSYKLIEKLSLIYGGGINYRRGYESIVVSYGKFFGFDTYHPNYISRNVNDFGLNIKSGLEYTPVKWFTLYSEFNFIGLLFFDNRETIELLQDGYGYENYPNRFDLSWRFGIGINF